MFFKDFYFISILLVIPILFYFYKNQRRPALRFSSGVFFENLNASFKIYAVKNLFLLKLLALVLLILALARPQSPLEGADVTTEGIDIVLAIDCSTSMLAQDFTLGGKRRNRLEVVKDVVEDFISKRRDDRIGIVAFAARPYTVSPLTLDYNWLTKNLERVEIGIIEDGTAVGSGLAASLHRLEKSTAKSKVVILLTDGRNNAGSISPNSASELARALGIKVYTIGAGSKGLVPYPVKDLFGRDVYRNIEIDLDEETLRDIARVSGGQYFNAQDTDSLRKVYKEIDKLEKTSIEDKGYLEYKELFYLFVILALFLLIIEEILATTVLMRIP